MNSRFTLGQSGMSHPGICVRVTCKHTLAWRVQPHHCSSSLSITTRIKTSICGVVRRVTALASSPFSHLRIPLLPCYSHRVKGVLHIRVHFGGCSLEPLSAATDCSLDLLTLRPACCIEAELRTRCSTKRVICVLTQDTSSLQISGESLEYPGGSIRGFLAPKATFNLPTLTSSIIYLLGPRQCLLQ